MGSEGEGYPELNCTGINISWDVLDSKASFHQTNESAQINCDRIVWTASQVRQLARSPQCLASETHQTNCVESTYDCMLGAAVLFFAMLLRMIYVRAGRYTNVQVLLW